MKKPLLVSLVCLVASAALLIWGFQAPAAPAAPREIQVALLVESDTGSFLMQLRKGMQEAAASGSVQIAVQKLQPDPAAQARELAQRGTSAALLLLENPRPMLAALQEAGIPALLIGQLLRGQICVTGDDGACGQALLARALTLAEPSRVLWLREEEDPRGKERTAGAEALLRQSGVATLPWPQSLETLASFDVLVASTQAVTRGLSALKGNGSLPQKVALLGMDTGDSRVADLEEKRVQVMAIDSPYAMGYIALELVPGLLAGELPPSVHTSPLTLVDPENMYLAENVKLVFPLLQ